MKVEYIEEYGRWTNIFSFLEDSEEHRKIFCERHNISMEELDNMLKRDYDKLLDLIESDSDEIQEILNEKAKDSDEFFYIVYDEKWDIIYAEKWRVVK